jgi:hypothetical protein
LGRAQLVKESGGERAGPAAAENVGLARHFRPRRSSTLPLNLATTASHEPNGRLRNASQPRMPAGTSRIESLRPSGISRARTHLCMSEHWAWRGDLPRKSQFPGHPTSRFHIGDAASIPLAGVWLPRHPGRNKHLGHERLRMWVGVDGTTISLVSGLRSPDHVPACDPLSPAATTRTPAPVHIISHPNALPTRAQPRDAPRLEL